MDKEQVLYELTAVRLEMVKMESIGINLTDGMMAVQRILTYEGLKAKTQLLQYQLSYINHKERMDV